MALRATTYSISIYHAAIIELFKNYSKHIDIKDINVTMINHLYIKKIQLFIYTNARYTLIGYSKYIIHNI